MVRTICVRTTESNRSNQHSPDTIYFRDLAPYIFRKLVMQQPFPAIPTIKRQVSASAMRLLADQTLSRVAGAPLIGGNSLRLLKDAKENYPAWLDAIASAESRIYFETYIIRHDDEGWKFAEALAKKAAAGVHVFLI